MRTLPGALIALTLVPGVSALAGCAKEASADVSTDPTFTLGTKNLLPPNLFEDQSKWTVYVGTPPAAPMEQPIQFTHQRHANLLGMDCQYCHSGARKDIHAGVPSTQVCMGCHKMIDPTGRPELDKLKGYWDRGEAIPWTKVHDLPDFVYFSHKRHVQGGVQCQECHGQVQDMTVNQRVATLQMGWCLDCHATHPSIDTNYGPKAELRRAELKDCWTCHK